MAMFFLEPLIVECGVDEEKIAVGVAFTISESEVIDPAALPQKIKSASVSSRLEKFIAASGSRLRSGRRPASTRGPPHRNRQPDWSSRKDRSESRRRKTGRRNLRLKPDSKISPLKADMWSSPISIIIVFSRRTARSADGQACHWGECRRGAEEIEAVMRISGENPDEEGSRELLGSRSRSPSNSGGNAG